MKRKNMVINEQLNMNINTHSHTRTHSLWSVSVATKSYKEIFVFMICRITCIDICGNTNNIIKTTITTATKFSRKSLINPQCTYVLSVAALVRSLAHAHIPTRSVISLYFSMLRDVRRHTNWKLYNTVVAIARITAYMLVLFIMLNPIHTIT